MELGSGVKSSASAFKLVSLGQNSGNFLQIYLSLLKQLSNEIKKTQCQSTLIGSLIFCVIAELIFFSSELSQKLNVPRSFDLSGSIIIFIVLGIGQIINCYFLPYGTVLFFK